MTERFRRRLKEVLERPRLASPDPAQARYRSRRRSAGYPAALWRLGGVAMAALLVGVAALSFGTRSGDPQVWSGRVAAAIRQIAAPPAATPAAVPSPEESPPAARPSASQTPAETANGGEDGAGSRPTETPETPGPHESSTPEPTSSGEPAGGDWGTPEPSPRPTSSPDWSPSPEPSPEADR